MTQDQVSQLLAAIPADAKVAIDWQSFLEKMVKAMPVIIALIQQFFPAKE